MKVTERMKIMIRNWLNIQPAPITSISLLETMPFEAKAVESMIWYRGDANELDQFYKQVSSDRVTAAKFWAANGGRNNRKLHTGLPAMIIDTLAYIVKNDLDSIKFENDNGADIWAEIAENENFDFNDIVEKGIVGALSSSDGAWKISVDQEVSDVPIVEFYKADRVQYVYRHGIITGIDFITDIRHKNKTLKLKEMYRKNCVKYELYDDERQLPLDVTEETKDLKPVEFDGDFMMAVPLKIYDNPKYPHRGKSIIEKKIDDFDAFDEVVSQWMDAFRQGRVQKYIPETLIPRDSYDGSLKPHNPFDNEYISVQDSMKENSTNEKIQVIQPEIHYEALLAGYTTTLDLCLQGLISPATLGIDMGKMSSADAQREKKDVTGITRNTITGKLETALPQLISAIIMTYETMYNRPVGKYKPIVTFGEYGAPDFDSRIETIGKAAVNNTMSIETQVEELWGSSKDDVWKEKEIARIKRQKGIEIADEPKNGD